MTWKLTFWSSSVPVKFSRAGVTWLPLTGQGATTYLVVDRSVRVALTVPDTVTSTGPWQEISKTVARALPARAICAGGVPIPADGE